MKNVKTKHMKQAIKLEIQTDFKLKNSRNQKTHLSQKSKTPKNKQNKIIEIIKQQINKNNNSNQVPKKHFIQKKNPKPKTSKKQRNKKQYGVLKKAKNKQAIAMIKKPKISTGAKIIQKPAKLNLTPKVKGKSNGPILYKRSSKNIKKLSKRLQKKSAKHKKEKVEYYISNLRKYVQNSVSKNNDPYFTKICQEHFVLLHESLQDCKYIEQLNEQEIQDMIVPLPPIRKGVTKTIVLDLDETLFHSLDDPTDNSGDVNLEIPCNDQSTYWLSLNVRPKVRQFLRALKKNFEIISFTASVQEYADKILEYIDPKDEFFDHRFYRESCVVTPDNIFMKDLRILGNRELKNVVLVDNSPYSFGPQIENGIPIIPFFDNKQDKELQDLLSYLNSLQQAKDVRVINHKTFKLLNIQDIEDTNQALDIITK